MRYEVRAVGRDGITSLALDAVDPQDARRQASAQGLTPLEVSSARRFARGSKRFPLGLFAQELVALLRAGLGIVEAIQGLAERHRGEDMRGVLEGVLARLRDGKALSDAFAAAPASFPQLFVETVRASERTGNLAESLGRYIHHDRQIDALRNRVVSASIYPLLLIGVGALVALFLLGYVVPRFSAIYTDVGQAMPFASRLLLEVGRFIDAHAWAVATVFGACVLGSAFALLHPRARAKLAALARAIPIIGPRMRTFELARFYRTAGMLVRGGIPFPRAMDMVAMLLDSALRAALARAVGEVREGKPISESLQRHGLAPPIAVRMLRVGERTGDMGAMLDQIASFHDEDLAHWLDRFMRLFEPLLMVAIGAIIGLIVVLLYMPIFELAGSLQ